MADQVTDLTHKKGHFRILLIDSCSLRAHMWQIRWQIYPPRNDNFRFLLIDSYSESSHVTDQVADLPNRNGNFRFLLIDSYPESSHVADQVTDLPPQKRQFYIPIYRFLLQELSGRSGGRSTPQK